MESLRTIRTEKGTFQSDMVRRVSGLSVGRKGTFQGDMEGGVSGQSVRAKAPCKGTWCGESQNYPLSPGHLPRGHAGRVSGPSVRASAPFKGTCCGESQANLFARRRLAKGHAGRSLKTSRSRQGTFQREKVRGVSGPSIRAMAPSRGTCCGDSQDSPLARWHLPKGHAGGVSGPSVRARALSKRTCRGESQDYPFAQGHLLRGHGAVSLRTILSREGAS